MAYVLGNKLGKLHELSDGMSFRNYLAKWKADCKSKLYKICVLCFKLT
jgi:hypothetical protein